MKRQVCGRSTDCNWRLTMAKPMTLVGSLVVMTLAINSLQGVQANSSTNKASSQREAGGSRFKRSCSGTTYTLETLIALIEKIENKSSDKFAPDVANRLRAFMYPGDKLWQIMCSVYTLDFGAELPNGALKKTESDLLKEILQHGTAKSHTVETGVVLTKNGDTIAPGHVITGLSCGGYRRDAYVGVYGLDAQMDTLFSTTLSGDLGQSTLEHGFGGKPSSLIGPAGIWDNPACPKVYTFNTHKSEATDAEMFADMDGIILGLLAPGLKQQRLSQIFRQYYGSGLDSAGKFKSVNRAINFKEAISDIELKRQTKSFAEYYYYGIISWKLAGSNWKSIKGVFTEDTWADYLKNTKKYKQKVDEIKKYWHPRLELTGKTVNKFYSESFMGKCTEELKRKYTINYFIGLVKKMEVDTNYAIDELTSAILRLSKYFEKMDRFDELMPSLSGNKEHTDGYEWYIMRELISYEIIRGRREIGVLQDNHHQTLAIGHVLAGIHASFSSDDVNDVYKTTVAGELAHTIIERYKSSTKTTKLLGATGKWDKSCPPKYTLSAFTNNDLHATKAELLGDIDGFLLAQHAKKYSKLSEILQEYYNSGLSQDKSVSSQNRLASFKATNKDSLIAQTMAACKELRGFFESTDFCAGSAKDAVEQLYTKILTTATKAGSFNSKFLPDFESLLKVYPGEPNHGGFLSDTKLRSTVAGARLISTDKSTMSALRVSYMLNRLDGHYVYKLPNPSGTIIGEDGKIYVLNLAKLKEYLNDKYGQPMVAKSLNDNIAKESGVIILYSNVANVAGLWGGDKLHAMHDYSKPSASVTQVYLWKIVRDCEWFADTGNCEFYRCVETMFPCGPDGYAMGYGYKYCNRFSQHVDTFSDAGKKWVKSVRTCLMKTLLPFYSNPLRTCPTIKEIAFDSHPDCYVIKNKADICDIYEDYLTLFQKVYDMTDLFSLDGVQQMAITIWFCALDSGNWLTNKAVETVEVVKNAVATIDAQQGIDSACTAYADKGDCAFYECFEKRFPCKDQHLIRHILDFELPVCKQHKDNSGLFDAQGKAWLLEMQRCIMQELLVLYKKPTINCANLAWIAFKSRLNCYTRKGFCQVIDELRNMFGLEQSMMHSGTFPVGIQANPYVLFEYEATIYYNRMLRMLQRYIGPMLSACYEERLRTTKTLYTLKRTSKGILKLQ